MNLVIVESPAKAKTINKYLGKNYLVLASYGHIRDLPSKNGSVNPDEGFGMIWETDSKSKKQVKEIYTTLLPLVFVGMLAVYLCKNQIIEIIYTDAFLSMTPLFKWQLLADFTRFLAVVLAYYFISKNAFGYFILTELISLVFYFIFAKVLISDYGTEGVVVANLLRYFCYLIMVFVAIFHYFKIRK